ncbi:sigma-70 family RNA polymerase sigma factor [Serpentinicella sp. ANB-PHB4]|uniref:sigma-70 family RNA polymerase sigma factor n=1 Tax=Serpentinicella sp. ANB-PHB4 TaxID=3074076 RepID=UPI0028616890|nr:sigma-70 family RNA polymerase sigma factor [Serpentinicella sp. ANB-PHB4]MDR5659940.1 sigma-70 family RNA polymerase sigma factor [Serpentinicella sp. ANB-PHB4]
MNFEEMVKKSAEGNADSQIVLIEQLRPLIISTMRRYGGVQGVDEDAYHDGVLEILKSFEDFDLNRGIPYLGYIKRRLMHFYQNRRRKEKICFSLDQNIGDEEGLSRVDILVDKTVDIEGQFLKERDVIHIRSALQTLTEHQRNIIIEHYFNNISLKDIALYKGVHPVTVSKVKASALKNLRKKLESIC